MQALSPRNNPGQASFASLEDLGWGLWLARGSKEGAPELVEQYCGVSILRRLSPCLRVPESFLCSSEPSSVGLYLDEAFVSSSWAMALGLETVLF